jgi:hypothetical protein
MNKNWNKEEDLIVQYLLGTLEEDETQKIEQRLLCDSTFFESRLLPVEGALINKYLAGLLTQREIELFERKYLSVPELRGKVDFARRMWAVAMDTSEEEPSLAYGILGFQFSTVMSAAFCTVGLGTLLAAWVIAGHPRASNPDGIRRDGQPAIQLAGDQRILVATLMPGLTLSGNDKPQRVHLTPDAQEIRLALELPGVRQRLEATVEVFLVEDNRHRLVWNRDGISSVSTLHGQTLLVSLTPQELGVGDYVAYIKKGPGLPERQAIESYSFGVVKP